MSTGPIFDNNKEELFPMSRFSLKNVLKRFSNGDTAISGVSLDVLDKEFVVLTGPQECGKSTLLRVIAGIEDITSGEIFIDGVSVNEKSPRERNIALLFQNNSLYPQMTVYDNIGYGLRARKFEEEEIESRINRIAETLNLSHILDKEPSMLSEKERKCVSIGKCAALNPAVFLLDDPLCDLDEETKKHTLDNIKKLYEELDSIFIYTTTSVDEAKTVGTKIAVLKDGILQQYGSANEICDSPANVFTAAFISDQKMQFSIAKTVKTGSKLNLFLDENNVITLSNSLSESLLEMGFEDQEVIVGIHPDNIELAESSLIYDSCVLECMVQDNDIDSGKLKVKLPGAKFVVSATKGLKAAQGDMIKIILKEHSIYLFDKNSQKVIIAN